MADRLKVGGGVAAGAGRLIAIRLGLGLATLFALSMLVFAATQALPGDAAVQVLGPHASASQMVAMRERLGLDRPLLTQYTGWVGGMLRGQLGTSLADGEPVARLLAPRIAATAMVVLLASGLAIPIALGLGVWSAMRRDSLVDVLGSGITLVAASLPEFVVGIGLIVLLATGVWHLLPPVSLIDPARSLWAQIPSIALPVLTLVVASIPYVLRMVRGSMVEVLDSDYVAMARLNGISERRVVLWHALPNAIAPTIQVIALTLNYLAGGVVVVEAVFNYPGVGTALVQAVRYRDLPVVQLLVLAIGAFYVVSNLLADLAAILITPRLRTAL